MSQKQALSIAASAVALGLCSSCASEAPYPRRENIGLSDVDRLTLLAAVSESMQETPSELLESAIETGAVQKIVAESIESELPKVDGNRLNQKTMTHYVARIYYEPIRVTETRLFKPVIYCAARSDWRSIEICLEESWIKLEMAWMPRPIRFGGELTDGDVAEIYKTVDELGLVSRTDSKLITSDKIYQILRYEHAGNRVNVYVTTEMKGYSDAIYLAKIDSNDSESQFELTEFRCGGDR